MAEHVRGCDAVVSCLGHNPKTIRDLYAEPRRLCTQISQMVCSTIHSIAPSRPIKYLVVSTGLVDTPADPKRGHLQRLVLWLLEWFLPPHVDNLANAAFLSALDSNPHVEFVAVRPDLLVNGDESQYAAHATLQNGIFNAGATSRANVGAFMAELVAVDATWERWKGRFPHLLNVVPKCR